MFNGKLNSVAQRGVLAAVAAVTLAGCSLFPGGKLAAYEVPVLVVDPSGRPVSSVEVRSTDDQMLRTDDSGLVRLYFISRGLHVITVRGEGWNTTQAKASVPMESPNPITIQVVPSSR